jgi:hypothetical protein
VDDLFVIHDELDLPAGVLRLKLGGGHAGHNGLRSLHQAFGSEYGRLRVGIGRPPGRVPAHAYVLQRMSGQEFEDFEVTVAQAVPVVRSVLQDGLTQAMNECNRDGGNGGGESDDGQGGVDGRGDKGQGASTVTADASAAVTVPLPVLPKSPASDVAEGSPDYPRAHGR